jgi:hypothetical protein
VKREIDEMVKQCACCGRFFKPQRGDSKYCGDKFCQKERNKDYLRRKNGKVEKPKTKDPLVEASIEARKLGLSYGQYIGYRDTGYLSKYKRMRKIHEL